MKPGSQRACWRDLLRPVRVLRERDALSRRLRDESAHAGDERSRATRGRSEPDARREPEYDPQVGPPPRYRASRAQPSGEVRGASVPTLVAFAGELDSRAMKTVRPAAGCRYFLPGPGRAPRVGASHPKVGAGSVRRNRSD